MNKRYNNNFKSRKKYGGLIIHAAKGLHERIYKEFSNLNINNDSNILVLGSGTGAFEKRLNDNNYKNIDSNEINIEQFKYKSKNNKLFNADLNKDFSKIIKKKYQVIFAIEVIEHLYSSYHFLNECKKILKDEGLLIISTPNLHNFQSRINFLIFGYPNYFIVPPKKYDHINPIFDNIFKHLIKELNLKIYKEKRVLSYFSDFEFHSFRSYLYYMLMKFLSIVLYPIMIFNKKLCKGTNVIYLIKK